MAPKRTLSSTTGQTPKKQKPTTQSSHDDDDVPIITSRIEQPRTTNPVLLPLSGRKRELYDMLLQEMDDIDNMPFTVPGKRTLKARTAAAIGVLVMMDDQILETLHIPKAIPKARYFTETLGHQAVRILDLWKNSGGQQTAIKRPREDTDAQTEVAKWYGHRCIICGRKHETEAAHILPNATERNEYLLHTLLAGLGTFWGPDYQERLSALLADPKHHKTNIIIMRKDIHGMWGTHKFYLRLLDGYTSTKQELEFRWLRKGQPGQEILTFEPPDEDYAIDLSSCRATHALISSGDKVILETIDPLNCPLPDPAFLLLQGHLHQALCLSASAEVLVRVFRKQEPPPMVPANKTITSSPDADEEEDEDEDDMVESPYFIEHLIEAAVDLAIIEPGEVPAWRKHFFPRCEHPTAPLYEEAEESEKPDEQEEPADSP